MKSRNIILISICFLFLLVSSPLFAGISETITHISETIERIAAVAEQLSHVAATLGSLTGAKPIIYLLGVLLLCAGLGATGLIYGRALFFTAMIVTDLLWFFIIGTAYQSRQTLLADISSANGWVLLPFLLLVLITKGVPRLYRLLRKLFFSGYLSKSESLKIMDQVNSAHGSLVSSMSRDMADASSSKIAISPDSRQKARQLIRELEKIYGSRQ